MGLDLIESTFAVENAFGLYLPEADTAKLTTPGPACWSITSCIDSRRQTARRALTKSRFTESDRRLSEPGARRELRSAKTRRGRRFCSLGRGRAI